MDQPADSQVAAESMADGVGMTDPHYAEETKAGERITWAQERGEEVRSLQHVGRTLGKKEEEEQRKEPSSWERRWLLRDWGRHCTKKDT